MSLGSRAESAHQRRVDELTVLARTPGAEVYAAPGDIDYQAWNHVGDPLCEGLLGMMRDRKLMSGDIYATARKLESEDAPEAVAFFADVEAIPTWLDVDSLRVGSKLGHRNPVGMLFGIHGALPLTYLDPATAEVMGSTGRLAARGGFNGYVFDSCTR